MRARIPTLFIFLLLVLVVAPSLPDRAEARGRRAKPTLCERLPYYQGIFEWLSARRWASPQLVEITGLLNEFINDRCVAMNEIQVIGSHNSYHLPPRPELLQAFVGVDPQALEWEYENLPLAQQLESQGIRQIELDVFADPDGGLYADRLALTLIGQDAASGEPALDEPGFKVLHVQHADFETTCLTFVACLQEVKGWSDDHPRHVPIMILIEAKDEPFFFPVLPLPIVIGTTELRELEDEILSVFPLDRIVKPDDVRGQYASVEEAIVSEGWPKLGTVRGKVLFGLDNGGLRDAFIDGDPSLSGRLIFPSSMPGNPDAAFVKLNDPQADPTLIPDLVAEGYIVRTRADAGLTAGRVGGDTAQREAALSGGAQYVSTDFADPSTIVSIDATQPFDPTYEVELPEGGAARCNPIIAPDFCRSGRLE